MSTKEYHLIQDYKPYIDSGAVENLIAVLLVGRVKETPLPSDQQDKLDNLIASDSLLRDPINAIETINKAIPESSTIPVFHKHLVASIRNQVDIVDSLLSCRTEIGEIEDPVQRITELFLFIQMITLLHNGMPTEVKQFQAYDTALLNSKTNNMLN
jgi:hypothetical protein